MSIDPTAPEGRAELITEGRRRLVAYESAKPESHEEMNAADEWHGWQIANGEELLDTIERQQEVIRGYEGAIEGLTVTIGEHRAQLDSVREYAQHLRELADAHRDTSTGYLAHVYAEIAVALERKIGDTCGGREVRGVVSVPVVPAVRCSSPAPAADPCGDSAVGAAAESGLDAS